MSDDLPPVLEFRYERFGPGAVEPPASESEIRDTKPIDAHTIRVERDEAYHVLQKIFDAVDERSQYYVIEEVVIGVEEYLKADVYCRCAHETPLDDVLGLDVIVISGSTIDPVVPTTRRLEEHLEEVQTRGDGDE